MACVMNNCYERVGSCGVFDDVDELFLHMGLQRHSHEPLLDIEISQNKARMRLNSCKL